MEDLINDEEIKKLLDEISKAEKRIEELEEQLKPISDEYKKVEEEKKGLEKNSQYYKLKDNEAKKLLVKMKAINETTNSIKRIISKKINEKRDMLNADREKSAEKLINLSKDPNAVKKQIEQISNKIKFLEGVNERDIANGVNVNDPIMKFRLESIEELKGELKRLDKESINKHIDDLNKQMEYMTYDKLKELQEARKAEEAKKAEEARKAEEVKKAEEAKKAEEKKDIWSDSSRDLNNSSNGSNSNTKSNQDKKMEINIQEYDGSEKDKKHITIDGKKVDINRELDKDTKDEITEMCKEVLGIEGKSSLLKTVKIASLRSKIDPAIVNALKETILSDKDKLQADIDEYEKMKKSGRGSIDKFLEAKEAAENAEFAIKKYNEAIKGYIKAIGGKGDIPFNLTYDCSGKMSANEYNSTYINAAEKAGATVVGKRRFFGLFKEKNSEQKAIGDGENTQTSGTTKTEKRTDFVPKAHIDHEKAQENAEKSTEQRQQEKENSI